MVDTDLLKKIVDDSGIKIGALCRKAGISRRSFYNKAKGGRSYLFNVRDIEGLSSALNMDDETIMRVFFAKNVYKNETNKEGK